MYAAEQYLEQVAVDVIFIHKSINMDFKNAKKQILQANDLSKKGSIDEGVRELVNFINEQDDYVTTSSCSGRAILFTSVSTV